MLATARERLEIAGGGRLVAVAQPHRYTRLRDLFDSFCACFDDADAVVVADVHAAGEAPIEGVGRDRLVAGLRARGHPRVVALPSPEALPATVHGLTRAGDLVVCLGAGSITRWANDLPRALARARRRAGTKGRAMNAACAALIDRLPRLRGRRRAAVPLYPYAWLRVGGPAEVLFEPEDRDDLRALLAGRPGCASVSVLGLCSNVLIRDGGIDGVAVRLGRPLRADLGDGRQGPLRRCRRDMSVARAAADAGVAGLEFLSGVPGSIGGAIRMNAGAYGREIGEIVESVEALDECGRPRRFDAADIEFGYRRSSLPEGWICVAATLRGAADRGGAARRRMAEIAARREASQPIRARTGGSTFANPPGRKAWELIDRAGCRGLRNGAAEVSRRHANFLVNTGAATAAELEDLGEIVRRRVFETTGVRLEWEIRRLGRRCRPAEARR